MRVVIGEFKQETNTFVTHPTTLQQFQDFHLWYGEDVRANLRDTNTEMGGFLDVGEAEGWELLPTLAGFAISGGPLTRPTYLSLREELLQRITACRPFDAVLLSLHGAMAAEDEDDADGATLEAIRNLIGPEIPLVVSLDLHANITQRCVEFANALVGFRTSPHIDQRETGQRAARLLARILAGEVRPRMAWKKIPLVTPASTHVHSQPGPFQRLMDASKTLEENGALSANVFTVQPWMDISDMGFAAIVVTNDDATQAQQMANELAKHAWAERHAFMDIDLVPPDRAIQQALAAPEGPIVLSDLADGTGAGSPGDSTAMIAALLRADPSAMCLVNVFDPETAELAAQIGVGGQIDCFVGGKRDNVYNHPVRFTGTVTWAQPAQFRFGGAGYTDVTMDMGLSAVLRHNNISLLVVSKPVFTVDPNLYRAADMEPADAQIVVVKSHIQFRAGYAIIARGIILLDTPGMSSDHLTQLDFRRVPRPLFPLDGDFTWHV